MVTLIWKDDECSIECRGRSQPSSSLHYCHMTAMISVDFHCKLMLICEVKPWCSRGDINGVLGWICPESRVCDLMVTVDTGSFFFPFCWPFLGKYWNGLRHFFWALSGQILELIKAWQRLFWERNII